MWPFYLHRSLKKIERLLERSVALQDESLKVLECIESKLPPKPVFAGFVITQLKEGEFDMPAQEPVVGIKIGATGTFLATPVDAQGNVVTLPAGIVPTWTSTDTLNAPVVAATDGLTATDTVPSTTSAALVGTNFTLSVTATLADGTAGSGTTPVPFLASGVVGPFAGFVITQTS
jgi:hypothetical protein